MRSAGNGVVDLNVISNSGGLHWVEAARAAGYKYAVIAQSAGAANFWQDEDLAEGLAESYENASAGVFSFHRPVWI